MNVIIGAFLVFMLLSNSIFATYFSNVLNESVTDTLDVYHLVDRKSNFQISFIRNIVNDGQTVIGNFKVDNNTVDGFEVLLSSQNGGVFSPASTLDGETDIPYSVLISYSGTLGTNVTSLDTISSSTLGSAATVSLLSTTYQTSPTEVEGIITISLTDTNNQFMMAGSYSDTITITYVDN